MLQASLDRRSASSTSWQTMLHLRRNKPCSSSTDYSGRRELLTSTGDIVRQGEENKDLLSPSDTPSIEAAEAADSEVNFTQAEVGDHTSQPPWKSLFQCTTMENVTNGLGLWGCSLHPVFSGCIWRGNKDVD